MSVLSRIKPTSQEILNSDYNGHSEANVTSYVPAPIQFPPIQSSRGPLTQIQKPASFSTPSSLLTDADIDRLGQEISSKVGPTTEKIMAKMNLGKFDELGAILTQIQAEADKLDPASIQKSGVAGWWQRKFGDIKQQLTLKLKSAEDVFDKLEEKISQHIAIQSEWVKDLELLYGENYLQYQKIQEDIATAEKWDQAQTQQLQQWPAIDPNDPEAMMKAQAKVDVENRLQRLRRKSDRFLRLRVITENNAPKIRSQQNTARSTISTLQDIVEQTIPLLKTEFALFIQSLDAQKSIQLVNSATDLANRTLVKGADTAKQTAVDAANAFNTPLVATNTLNHIRNRMLETVQEVGKINKDAAVTREADAKMLSETQKQYLETLQQNGAV